MQHFVSDIQRFCMHDGPGIRTAVFLKGCPLDCFWCHNPEGKSPRPQLMYRAAKCIGCGACVCERGVHSFLPEHRVDFSSCIACGHCTEVCPTSALSSVGKPRQTEEIIEIALRDKAFYGNSGGITLSGGEPMFHPEETLYLLEKAKAAGLHTAVETCGFFPEKYVEPLCRFADILLWDIKDTDPSRHIQNTGVPLNPILDNLRLADAYSTPIVLRCVLLKGVNLNEQHLNNLKDLSRSLRNFGGMDFLPCHSLGNSKAESLGLPAVSLSFFEPSGEDMARVFREMKDFLR